MQTNVGNGRVVRVTVPANVARDLDKMEKVTKSILSRLGCAPCHSGWDIRFTEEAEFLVGSDLSVQAVAAQE